MDSEDDPPPTPAPPPSKGWTPERRARQAELIRQTKPWEKSTGPKTQTGKIQRFRLHNTSDKA